MNKFSPARSGVKAGVHMVRVKDCTNPLLNWYRPHKLKVFQVRSWSSDNAWSPLPKNVTAQKVWVVCAGPYHGNLIQRKDCEALIVGH